MPRSDLPGPASLRVFLAHFWRNRSAAAVLISVVLLAWIVVSSGPMVANISLYADMGEVLLHDLGPMAERVSARLPGCTLFSALLSYHAEIPHAALLLAFQFLETSLIIVLATFLSEFGFLIAPLAVVFLASIRLLDLTPDNAFFLLFLLTACVTAWRARNPSHPRSAVLALCVGTTLLFRSTLIVFLPVLALYEWIFFYRFSVRAYWRHFFILGLLPYVFLLPWIGLNWTIHRKFIPTEEGPGRGNLIMGALGVVHALGGNSGDPPFIVQSAGLATLDSRHGDPVFGWALREIARNPMRYLVSCLQRLWFTISLQPFLFLLAAASLWIYRARSEFRSLGILTSYFVLMHCSMAVVPRYFEPLWPLLAVLAGAALFGRRAGAVPPKGTIEYRFCEATMKCVLGVSLVFCLYVNCVVVRFEKGVGLPLSELDSRLDRAILSHPRDAWLLWQRGNKSFSEGKFAKSLEDYSLAANLKPFDGDLQMDRAWARALAGFSFELLNWRLSPDQSGDSTQNLALNVRKAFVHLREGRNQKGEAHLKAALDAYSRGYVFFRGTPADAEIKVADRIRASMGDEFVAYCDSLLGLRPADKLALTKAHFKLMPETSGLWLLRAEGEADFGRRSAALRALAQSARLEPRDGERLRIAMLYRKYAEYALASAILKPLGEAAVSSPWIERCELALGAGDRSGALEALARAEALDPVDEERLAIAGLYRRLNENARALAAVGPVLKRTKLAAPWIGSAEMAAANGDQTSARNSLQRAMALQPSDMERRRISALYRRFKEYDSALAALEPAVSRTKEPRLWIERAELAALLDRRALALESLAAIDGLDPGNEDRRQIARLYQELRAYEKALEALESLTRRLPRDAGLWVEKSNAARSLGKKDLARDSLAKAESLGPTDEDLRRIAQGYQELAAYSRELSILEALTRRHPTRGEFYADRGISKYRNGSPGEAIVDLKAAIRLNPGLKAAYLSLGSIYVEQGRSREALALYDEAIKSESSQSADPLLALLRKTRGDLSGKMEAPAVKH